MDLIRSRIKVKSLNFMRGRTFINKFLIIDEAQNLTPKQMKTLITRAGPGTKVVCLGNIAQIDTPYLTEGSSGLTYVVDRFKGWPHSGHVTLQRGERRAWRITPPRCSRSCRSSRVKEPNPKRGFRTACTRRGR
jgi:PhoH-like ATPase